MPRRVSVFAGGLGLRGLATTARHFTRPVRDLPDAPHRPDPRLWPDRGLHAAWIGHSTVLLKIDGFTMITDPVFSSKAGLHLPMVSIGVKRLVQPALETEDLPHVDLVLQSHAHMDHFDLPSLRSLESKRTRMITARATSDLLRPRRWGKIIELGWNETTRVGPATIKAIHVRHWGRRYLADDFRGYNGYLVQIGRYRMLFAGDTAYTDVFARERFREGVHLALMPIGAYNPWIGNHCNPEQAWRMAEQAGADFLFPIHHSTFALGKEPIHEPLERIMDAAKNRQSSLAVREIGQEFHLS